MKNDTRVGKSVLRQVRKEDATTDELLLDRIYGKPANAEALALIQSCDTVLPLIHRTVLKQVWLVERRVNRSKMENQINEHGDETKAEVSQLNPLQSLQHLALPKPARQTGDELPCLLPQCRDPE